LHDPVAAVLFCNTPRVDYNIVHGRIVVKDGEMMTVDEPRQVEIHNQAARRLLNSAG